MKISPAVISANAISAPNAAPKLAQKRLFFQTAIPLNTITPNGMSKSSPNAPCASPV